MIDTSNFPKWVTHYKKALPDEEVYHLYMVVEGKLIKDVVVFDVTNFRCLSEYDEPKDFDTEGLIEVI